MKDNDKHGFGTFGAIVLGVTAVATAIVAVSKSKKKKQSFNSFLKDELVKLPLFSKDESHHVKKHVADEDDIFVDEDNDTQDDKATSFYDEEISYEEDEEFQSVSKAKPIVDFKPKHDAPQKPAEETEAVQEKAAEEAEATDGQQEKAAEEVESTDRQQEKAAEEVESTDGQQEKAAEEAETTDGQQEKVVEQAKVADEVKQGETVKMAESATEQADESAEVSDEQPEVVAEQEEVVEETVQTHPEALEQAEESAEVSDEQPEVVAEQAEPVQEDNFESVGNTSTLASGDGTDDVFEEEPAIDTEKKSEAVEEPDDTFVFESVVVGREVVKDEPVDISDKKLDREFIAEPVDAEPARDNFVLNDEDVSEEVQEIEIDDVTTEPAEGKVAEPEKEESPVSAEKYDDVSSEAETAKEDIAATVETPVRETFSEVEFFDDEDDDIEEGLRSNESYYDWTYNVDEHYSVITDGTWVYCKSDDVLTSDSVNKKGERETIDIVDTFKNRIKTKGYCLLKYIGTDREVIVPDTINGKPVVAALNTFRSNQIVKKVILPSTIQGLRRTFYSCYHLDSITFAPGTNLLYELDAIMCGNNDMDSNTEATTVYCSRATAEYIKGHYRLGCPVIFVEK